MVLFTGKKIANIILYQEKSQKLFLKINLEHYFFIILYLICLYYCYITIGEQYIEALNMYEHNDINVLDDYNKLRNNAEKFVNGKINVNLNNNYFLGDLNNINNNNNNEIILNSDTMISTSPNYVIPSKYTPGFWPSVFLFITFSLHILFILLQKWSIKFKCLIKFNKINNNNINDVTHVHIIPIPHHGKEVLVPILYTNDKTMYFEYNRRKYLYDNSINCFNKIKCRSNYSINHYSQWNGIPNELILSQLKELYGLNRFQMNSPAFLDLYFEQITSPFTVFQIFSTVLWCLDSYWQYSLFSFFMIFLFEGTTVFSRLRSLSMLKSMGNENSSIYVYRHKKWIEVTTEDLVPGDLFSLVKLTNQSDIIPCDAIIIAGGAVVNESTLTGESIPQMKDSIITSISGSNELDTCVNIKGIHKVNTLFGGTRILQVSSVATKTLEETEDLHDEKEQDEYLLSHKNSNNNNNNSNNNNNKLHNSQEKLTIIQQYQQLVPPPPNDGCICYCIRTGFSSSQGKLVRLIESSQSTTVRGDTFDTVLLLCLLLIFALSASGYVLYRGMLENTRSRYQLLLHCILIVTSVVPPELPMQTALAVNNSLMTLMKMQLFCTEPFRVPIAGKVDTCVFDKTGTLTTDELVAVGIVPTTTTVDDLINAHKEAIKKMEESVQESNNNNNILPIQNKSRTFFGIPLPTPPNTPITNLPFPIIKNTVSVAGAGMCSLKNENNLITDAIFVLGTCHSLVLIDNEIGGDPLESAAMKSIKWELHNKMKDVVRPIPHTIANKPFEIKLPAVKGGSSSNAAKTIQLTNAKIIARHHFSSKLQRMSTVVRIPGIDGGMVVVKGSPEAILTMCTSIPKDYIEVSKHLAKRGMRVIALAWRRISNEQISLCCESRLEVEKDLIFVGFISFMCRVRKDTADIIHQLREGGHTVAMATGDAILTGIHVAQEVGITTSSKKGTLLLELNDNKLKWIHFETDKELIDNDNNQLIQYDTNKLEKLSLNYDLCITGNVLTYILDTYPLTAKYLHLFAVFARMRPDEKERVLMLMKDNGRITVMCGDGANDVGALRQAHVGIALLSGFGDLNGVKETKTDIKNTNLITNNNNNNINNNNNNIPLSNTDLDNKFNAMIITETDQELLRLPLSELIRRLRLIGIDPNDYPPSSLDKPNELIAIYRKCAIEKAEENKDIIRQRKLMKMTPQQRQIELSKENQENMIKKQKEFQEEYERLLAAGDSWAMVTAMKNMWSKEQENVKKMRSKQQQNMSIQGSAGNIAKMMEGMEGMEDLDMPMIKIGDASVASPFTSKMPSIRGTVDIIRQGRCTLVTTIQMYQILALNCLINAYSLSVLHLDGVKYGDKQLTCLGMLMSASFISVSRSQPLDKLSPIRPLKSVFHPAYFLSLLGQFILHLCTMYYLVKESKKYLPDNYKPDLDGIFHQNIINSVVFLVTAVQQVSVFVVNLKGPPYMSGLTQNSPLLYSLVITFIGVFLCASETVPQVNKWLQLEPFPTSGFRNMVLIFLLFDVLGAYIWDRLLLGIFAFPVLQASIKATTRAELFNIIKVIVVVGSIMYYLTQQDFTEIWEEYERQLNETLIDENIQQNNTINIINNNINNHLDHNNIINTNIIQEF